MIEQERDATQICLGNLLNLQEQRWLKGTSYNQKAYPSIGGNSQNWVLGPVGPPKGSRRHGWRLTKLCTWGCGLVGLLFPRNHLLRIKLGKGPCESWHLHEIPNPFRIQEIPCLMSHPPGENTDVAIPVKERETEETLTWPRPQSPVAVGDAWSFHAEHIFELRQLTFSN